MSHEDEFDGDDLDHSADQDQDQDPDQDQEEEEEEEDAGEGEGEGGEGGGEGEDGEDGEGEGEHEEETDEQAAQDVPLDTQAADELGVGAADSVVVGEGEDGEGGVVAGGDEAAAAVAATGAAGGGADVEEKKLAIDPELGENGIDATLVSTTEEVERHPDHPEEDEEERRLRLEQEELEFERQEEEKRRLAELAELRRQQIEAQRRAEEEELLARRKAEEEAARLLAEARAREEAEARERARQLQLAEEARLAAARALREEEDKLLGLVSEPLPPLPPISAGDADDLLPAPQRRAISTEEELLIKREKDAQRLAQQWLYILKDSKLDPQTLEQLIPILVEAIAALMKEVELEAGRAAAYSKAIKRNPSMRERRPLNPIQFLASYLTRHNPKYCKKSNPVTAIYSQELSQLIAQLASAPTST